MIRALALVFVGSLVFVSVASADIPLPRDLTYIDPRVRFEGIDKYPDQVFYLRFLTFTGGPGGVPYKLVAVKDTKDFALGAQRRLINMQLLALERKEFEKRAKEDSSLKWLTDKSEGVLAARVNTPSTTARRNEKPPVTTYRVTLEDGKLKVEQVQSKKTSDATPIRAVPMVAVGLALTVSLSWLGIWLVRRRNA